MAMSHNGLVKVSEECAEVIQVAQKMIAYPQLQLSEGILSSGLHPDGTCLRDQLEDELGDALAAITFVAEKLRLDKERMTARLVHKLGLFRQWDNEP